MKIGLGKCWAVLSTPKRYASLEKIVGMQKSPIFFFFSKEPRGFI